MKRRTILLIILNFILIGGVIGYYFTIYIPELRTKKRIKPLLDAGLSLDEALDFDRNYRIYAPYNDTMIKLATYWVKSPQFVDKVVEKCKTWEDRFYVINEVVPFIDNPLTKEQAHKLIDEWYPSLFHECKKKNVNVIFGDVDGEGINNYEEIFKYKTDPLTADTDNDENTDYEEIFGWVKQLGDEINPGYIDPLIWSPIFEIKTSPDPYIDFEVYYFGRVFVAKARTQLWNFRWPIEDPGDECMYVHYLVGYIENGEWNFAEGFEDFVKTDVIKESGKYLEWSSYVKESTFNFNSYAYIKLFVVDNHPIFYVNITLTPEEDINNVVNLYVELGRKSNGYKWVAIKTRYGVLQKNMTYSGVEEYVGHYFVDKKIEKYDWIMGRAINDKASFALVFKSAKTIYPNNSIEYQDAISAIALDTSGHYDTIELHHILRKWWNSETLRSGLSYNMEYYIFISDEVGYDWIESLVDIVKSF